MPVLLWMLELVLSDSACVAPAALPCPSCRSSHPLCGHVDGPYLFAHLALCSTPLLWPGWACAFSVLVSAAIADPTVVSFWSLLLWVSEESRRYRFLDKVLRNTRNRGTVTWESFFAGRKQPKDESDSRGYPQEPGECRYWVEACGKSLCAQYYKLGGPATQDWRKWGSWVLEFYAQWQIAFCGKRVPGLGKLLGYGGLPNQIPLLPRWAFNAFFEFQSLQDCLDPMST